MKKQAMQHTYTKGKLAWALPILFSSLSACVGPVREGDVDWEEFQAVVNEGASEIDTIDSEIAALEAERSLLADSVSNKEDYIAQGVSAGAGDVAARWHRMKEVEVALEDLQVKRSMLDIDEKGLDLSREATKVSMEADVDEFLVDAWKRTRKGARNLHYNYGFGASTDNTVNLTGTVTDAVGATTPFTGTLNGNSMKTDSADLGFEYYFEDDWAVEAGVIFGSAARDEESIDYGVLSYDDEQRHRTSADLPALLSPTTMTVRRVESMLFSFMYSSAQVILEHAPTMNVMMVKISSVTRRSFASPSV